MNKRILFYHSHFLFLCIFIIFLHPLTALSQEADKKPKLAPEAKQAREQTLKMLDEMEDILKEHYYDPTFHGIDLKNRIEAAKGRIKTLEYNFQMYRVLVQLLMDFDDSHTRLVMPPRTDYFQYGIGWEMVGDVCYVTQIKKDSNAAKQGIELGDQILSIGKFAPSRNHLWKINYLIYKLDPAKTLPLKIKKLDGTETSVVIEAKTMTEKEFRAEQKEEKEKRKKSQEKEKDEDGSFKCHEIDKTLAACKLYSFVVEKKDIDKMMKFASSYPKLILDLRGNGGGYVTIEEYLLSFFFEKPVKIADIVTKTKTETRLTEVLGPSKRYRGDVAVLIDSRSASASEITARVLQLEQRAKIYGDRSSGSVMTSITLPFRSLMTMLMGSAVIRAGMSVTVADVIMRDRSRLEKIGVVPDEVLQPTGLAFKNRMDPVLSFAAIKFGSSISPEDAGKLYFIMEKDEADNSDDETGK